MYSISIRNMIGLVLLGMSIGALIGDVHLRYVSICETSCREAFIRTAMNDPEWSKGVWEEISSRLMEKRNNERIQP